MLYLESCISDATDAEFICWSTRHDNVRDAFGKSGPGSVKLEWKPEALAPCLMKTTG